MAPFPLVRSLIRCKCAHFNTLKHFNMNLKPIKSNVQPFPTELFDVGGHCWNMQAFLRKMLSSLEGNAAALLRLMKVGITIRNTHVVVSLLAQLQFTHTERFPGVRVCVCGCVADR